VSGPGGPPESPFGRLPMDPLRLLVVTYYFPPSGGAGVQRPLKWVRYLPEHGVEPVVLTVRAGAYPALDPGLAADVPPGTTVIRTPAPDPFGLYGRLTGRSRGEAVAARTGTVGQSAALPERLSRWARANLFVPDARVGWVPFAVRAARRLYREAPFDAVLTTGPPHSAHLVGRALRRRLGVPWTADLRDPWTDIHYADALGRSAAAVRLDARLEASVLREASALVTVTAPLRDAFAVRAGRPVALVRNGFDPADFAGPVRARPAAPPFGPFEVLYTGTLYDVPTTLLDAVQRLRADGLDVPLRVVGAAPETLGPEAERRGVGDLVRVEPPVPHDAAVAAMRSAGVLLLTVEAWSYAAGVVPGKTYEYLASGRPTLGLGPPEGDAAFVLRDAGGGTMHAPGDVDGVAAVLREHACAWAAGTPRTGARADALAPYARPAQAGALADVVRATVGTGAGR
jgi:glycosyltransferase involved in cell wall biosynthesis